MYFPIGWPKSVDLQLPGQSVNHVCCDAVKILIAAAGDSFLGIFYSNPLVPISFYKRQTSSVKNLGENKTIIWKPDSRQLIVLTSVGLILLYQIDYDANSAAILTQVDPSVSNLRRDSAELFVKENIPSLNLREVSSIRIGSTVTTLSCISLTELLIATNNCELLTVHWDELQVQTGNEHETVTVNDAIIDLHSIPFYVNRVTNLRYPPIASDSYVTSFEYSPFIGGCAVVFSDYRAAFLVASQLSFKPTKMHGFWVPDVIDATVCSVNHKFRLLAYGRCNSDVEIYTIEEGNGGLEFSHRLSLNTNVIPGSMGSVNEMKWSPDGCVIAVTWTNGGISVWSTFGALLMSSLNWDFSLNVDLLSNNPLRFNRLEWSTEGYQLFMTRAKSEDGDAESLRTNVLQMNFVKSTLTMNPCMTAQPHVLLQGDDRLFLNQGDNLETIYFGSKSSFPNIDRSSSLLNTSKKENFSLEDTFEIKSSIDKSSILAESKYWTVLQLPLAYASTNWPIRYSAIDADGTHLAVAGRTGVAHYSMLTRKWKLFGNESQEKDFVVSGGLLWWMGFLVMGCYSLLDRTDEIRCYPEECKLDNQFGNKIQVRAPIISLNMFREQLIVLTADGIVSLLILRKLDAYTLNAECAYEIDVKSICIHPACIVSLMITNLRNDVTTKPAATVTTDAVCDLAETVIVNVCGRILMIQRDSRHNVVNSLMASCLASCVECFWLSNGLEKSPMRDCLWLYSGAHGMRVWLPILPPATEKIPDRHTFMAKRIMLSFPLKLYPLVILFDNVIVLGVENETTLYTTELNSHFSLPFCLLERKSQVYLHKVLRQLIKRNLGYSAWEIAKSCRSLPYFPHSLELLLHEVLEEEATSKEPIPDALLPSVLDFIREFPVYLQTIVQCARKTEIALWPYLFSIAGKPKDLFQQCLELEELHTAASYLIILQNLEPSFISKQYATLLLDIAIQNRKWLLAKDLIRFLKAIDPNEIDSPRSSMVVNVKIAPPSQAQTQVNQHPDVFNLVLGPIARERSFSTTVITNLPIEKVSSKQINTASSSTTSASVLATNSIDTMSTANAIRRKSEGRATTPKVKKEIFCIETILQNHARKLLQSFKLLDLGNMIAFLDFHLVTWLTQESERSTRIYDFSTALMNVHEELELPPPADTENSYNKETGNLKNQIEQNGQILTFGRHGSNQTSESGYVSLTHADTPTSVNNGNLTNIPSIKENEELQYENFITEHCRNERQHNFNASSIYNKPQSDSKSSIEAVFLRSNSFQDEAKSSITHALGLCVGNLESQFLPISEKLAIKLRYLLQLFIEANCTDYAILLSIVLQDSASIGRIINVLIRSESLGVCSHIEQELKSLAQWAFNRECIYRLFMMSLQPHIYQLGKFVTTNCNENRTANTQSAIDVEDSQTETNTEDDINIINSNLNANANNINRPPHSKLSWSDKPLNQLKRQTSLLETRTSNRTSSVNDQSSYIKPSETGTCRLM